VRQHERAFLNPHGSATATAVTLESSPVSKKKACDSQQGVLEARLRRGHDADPGNAFPRKGKGGFRQRLVRPTEQPDLPLYIRDASAARRDIWFQIRNSRLADEFEAK
jgi:hypothetical protein